MDYVVQIEFAMLEFVRISLCRSCALVSLWVHFSFQLSPKQLTVDFLSLSESVCMTSWCWHESCSPNVWLDKIHCQTGQWCTIYRCPLRLIPSLCSSDLHAYFHKESLTCYCLIYYQLQLLCLSDWEQIFYKYLRASAENNQLILIKTHIKCIYFTPD